MRLASRYTAGTPRRQPIAFEHPLSAPQRPAAGARLSRIAAWRVVQADRAPGSASFVSRGWRARNLPPWMATLAEFDQSTGDKYYYDARAKVLYVTLAPTVFLR